MYEGLSRDEVEAIMDTLLSNYLSVSQAMWRFPELDVVRAVKFDRPVLEIGCGSGTFTRLAMGHVEKAIDINPKAVERARRQIGIYESVETQDARDLTTDPESFSTVFANCVLEHIPDLPGVLSSCQLALRPGGRLVATVPLPEMNNHLLFRRRRYAAWRQRGLVHLNLWTVEKWESALSEAGFASVSSVPYLSPRLCRIWDLLDGPLMVGWRRYRLNAVLRYGRLVLPKQWRRALRGWLAPRLVRVVRKRPVGAGVACAALIVATK
jgi:SAM-dependent methyltransferase